MNEFYSIAPENVEPVQYQLENLGKQKETFSGVKRNRDPWGPRTNERTTIYGDVGKGDYDNLFAFKIIRTDPPFDVDKLITFHLDYYLAAGGDKDRFVKQIRYVVLEYMKKWYRDYPAHIELTNEWLAEQSTKSKNNANMGTTITGNNNFVTVAGGDVSQSGISLNISHDQYGELRSLGVEEKHINELKEIVSTKNGDKTTMKSRLSKLLSAVTVSVVTRGITEGLPRLQEIGSQLLHQFQ